jgi:hypothetical protein
MLSDALYGTPDLSFLILYFANMTHPSQFNRKKIKVLPKSKVALVLNDLKNMYGSQVHKNLENPYVYKASYYQE